MNVIKVAYKRAEEKLEEICNAHNIDKSQYLKPLYDFNKFEKCDFMKHFCEHLQNRQRMENIVKYNQNKDSLNDILQEFNPEKINKITNEKLYDKFKADKAYNITDEHTTLIDQYIQGVKDYAQYLTDNTLDDIKNDIKTKFVDEKDSEILYKNILEYSKNYTGMGFALACDYLKEIGCENLCKPDVHIKEICKKICPNGHKSYSDKEAFVKICEIAKENNITPYKVDKVFWLLSTGDFYKDELLKFRRNDLIQLFDDLDNK